MSFDWHEYFALAQELVTTTSFTTSEEARLRSAISRAYYAVHKIGIEVAETTSPFRARREGEVHGELINHFSRSPNADERRVGIRLRNLHRLRNQADYDSGMSALSNNTATCLMAAREAIQILDRLLQPPLHR